MPEETIEAKTRRLDKPQLIRSILAGIYIALGATLMLACKESGLPPIVGGLAFSLGLWLTICANGELFTGNCLLLAEYQPWKKNQSMRSAAIGRRNSGIVRCLCVTYLGNLVGSLAMFAAIRATGAYGDVAITVASTKCAAPVLETFVRAILCNVCVCLAVWLGIRQTSPAERLVCVALPVACFVTCGWEHSIADMFLLLLGHAPEGDMLRVLATATLGNIVGGYLVAKAMKSI